ncbi:hypothetical protein EDC39_11290 [Geothermobacter ehrlichii]|uniref:Uncharacterized protein n=1 Tax=Geothermobacter ehrlichii TaxID=213224 RepID=A0A5D3WHK1_9BACT|nr:hypothetical protein [Geothermobacter ehrlichii]TYO96802.1 hypothetical protein EDC39_11290 [Geothermobacter ehrlichii]
MPRSEEAKKYSEKVKEILSRQQPMSFEEFREQSRKVLANAKPILRRPLPPKK